MGLHVTSTILIQLFTCIFLGTSPTDASVTSLAYQNLVSHKDQKQGSTITVDSKLLATLLPTATSQCLDGANVESCQAVANLCILQLLEPLSASCTAYNQIKAAAEDCESGEGCSQPKDIPAIAYSGATPADIVRQTQDNMQMSIMSRNGYVHHLDLLLSVYDLNGTWLGYQNLYHQLDLCGHDDDVIYKAQHFGTNVAAQCYFNVQSLMASDPTRFYEMYLRGPNGTLYPVPVLMRWDKDGDLLDTDYFSTDFNEFFDEVYYAPKTLAKRVFLCDNVGGIDRSDPSIQYVRFASEVLLLVSLQEGQGEMIYPPLLVVKYASRKISLPVPLANITIRTNMTHNPISQPIVTYSVIYTMPMASFDSAIIWAVVVASCISAVYMIWGTTAWMRRQARSLIDLECLYNGLGYFCGAGSFLLSILLFGTSGYWYIIYKHQAMIKILLPLTADELGWALIIALIMKLFHVLQIAHRQVTCDIFFVDWERPQGKDVYGTQGQGPVSIWRSVFVANQFHQLQNHTTPLRIELMLVLMVAFLKGADYEGLATAQPNASDLEANSVPVHPVLRFAVTTFFWVVIYLVLEVYNACIYYRFVQQDPVAQFVDLCSVANVSVFTLLESNWGYYIHGKSVHDHADTDLRNFHIKLQQEVDGHVPDRGLAKCSNLQTYEIFVENRFKLKWLWHMAQLRDVQGRAGPRANVEQFALLHLLSGRRPRVMLSEAQTQAYAELNDFMQMVIHQVHDEVREKDFWHRIGGMPPMIAPHFSQMSNLPMAMIYGDQSVQFKKVLLLGMQHSIFLFVVLLYSVLDFFLMDIYVAMVLTYIAYIFGVKCRARLAEANIIAKTFMDDRFLLD